MDLGEIDRQIRMCYAEINACNNAIGDLNGANAAINNSTPCLQNTISNFENGLRCDAGKISTEKAKNCKNDSISQMDNIASIIASLQSTISYLYERIRELEAERQAEIARLQALAEAAERQREAEAAKK